jgi:hypothetical protein
MRNFNSSMHRKFRANGGFDPPQLLLLRAHENYEAAVGNQYMAQDMAHQIDSTGRRRILGTNKYKIKSLVCWPPRSDVAQMNSVCPMRKTLLSQLNKLWNDVQPVIWIGVIGRLVCSLSTATRTLQASFGVALAGRRGPRRPKRRIGTGIPSPLTLPPSCYLR